MQVKRTLLLVGLVWATGTSVFLLGWAESTPHQQHPGGTSSPMTTGQTKGQNSMQQMMRTMMFGVVPAGLKPGDLPDPSSEGAKSVGRYCTQCHDLPSPSMHAADEWPGIAKRMFSRMVMCSQMSGMGTTGEMGGMGTSGMMGMMNIKAPSAAERKVIVEYLTNHSLKSIRPDALQSFHTEGALRFAATCAQCHALPDPGQHTAQEWPGIVARMSKNMAAMGKAPPDAATLRSITRFLEDAARPKP